MTTTATPRRHRRRFALGCAAVLLAGVGVAGAAPMSDDATATSYVPVVPERVLDTRTGVGAEVGKVTAVTLSFAGSSVVPADAHAVAFNLTATEGTLDSYLAAQPSGSTDAGISTVNFRAGEDAANLVVVPLGADHAVRITNQFGQVHVVADLAGYYVETPAGNGPAGPAGVDGVDGEQGEQGIQGIQGIQGPAGPMATMEFGSVLNTGAQVVPIEAAIAFDTNGPLSPGITHSPGSANLTVVEGGTYLVRFVVSSVEPSQWGVFVNGTPVATAIFGSGAGTQQAVGETILSLSDGDVLTLHNHTSAAAVTLQTLAGGTQVNANAYLSVIQLALPLT